LTRLYFILILVKIIDMFLYLILILVKIVYKGNNKITELRTILPLNRNERGRFGALKSDSTHHFFRNACTKSGPLRFSQFSGCWLILSVYIIMSFDFPLKNKYSKQCSVRLCFQLFEWGLVSYLRYLFLFASSRVQHILTIWIT
jgi:hypothetical protein